MKKIVNNTHLEGYLFSHTLEKKVSGDTAKTPGVEFIAGTLDIATDDDAMNVVPVNFRYVVAKTKAGKTNATYTTLLNIIEHGAGKTYQDVKTDAIKLKVDTALGLNDFYSAENDLVSYKINDGGFVHVINSFSTDRNSFQLDVLIMNTIMREADEDAGKEELLIVKGATFNFMNSILPIDLVVKDPAGMKWFENLEATPANPIFMKVWGNILASTVETQTVEESAFGEAAVKISTRRLREWVITGASTEPYAYGDEAVLTPEEVSAAVAAREVYLADVKRRHDEYMASKSGNATTAPTPKAAGFAF